MHSPVFELAVLKIQDHKKRDLSASEKCTAISLLLKQMSVSVEEPEPDSQSIVERAMKRL